MKQLLKKNKVLCAILLIILIGIIVILVKGFNVETLYKEHYRVIINMKQKVNCREIKEIASDVFDQKGIVVQPATKFNDYVSISVLSIKDDNKTNLVNKLNEKYSLELTSEDLQIEHIPNTRLVSLVKPYVIPFVIITVIIAIYVAIRFRKMNSIKAVLKFLFYMIITELLVFSLIAILRIPIGKFIASLIIIAYIIGSILSFKKLENNNI